MRYVSGTKLDERIIRCDLDTGYKDGRQFGRGRSGGQASWLASILGTAQSDDARYEMSIVRITMLDVVDGVPKHSYSRKKQEERLEKSCIVTPRTFRGRLLEVEKTGKKVSNPCGQVFCWYSNSFQGGTGANSRKRQRSPDDDGDDMRDVSTRFMKLFSLTRNGRDDSMSNER